MEGKVVEGIDVVRIYDKVEGTMDNIRRTDEKVVKEMKYSDTNDKNDHCDDSKEDINNNKTNYLNDSSCREDNGTNNTMEGNMAEGVDVVYINDKVEGTTDHIKRTDEFF